MWNGAQKRLLLIIIFIPIPGGGLEGILIKFADARKPGEIASVSE